MVKNLALLTLDEAMRQDAQARTLDTVPRRPPAPSPACLLSRPREYVLPPQLLPGPFSIVLR